MFAAPSIGTRPFIEQAFAREHISIDFAGFSGETLHGVVQEPLDKIRIGRIRPASIAIRMLLPDTTRPMVLPCRAYDLSDDPDYRERATRLTARHAHAILDSVQELTRIGLLQSATAQIRAHPCVLLFKLYILNGEEVFFGFTTSRTAASPPTSPTSGRHGTGSPPCGRPSATSTPHDSSP